MKLIVISSPDKFKSEISQVVGLFESGLESFHLKKSGFSFEKMEKYIKMIPEMYHNRIVLHSCHNLVSRYNLKGIHISRRHKKKKFKLWWNLKKLKFKRPDLTITTSFHSLLGLLEDEKEYSYVFLSPVFDSISKKGHSGAFSHDSLKATLGKTKHKVIALGGVNKDRIRDVKYLGFHGMALLGAIWDSASNPVDVFKEVKEISINGKKKNGINSIEITPVKIDVKYK